MWAEYLVDNYDLVDGHTEQVRQDHQIVDGWHRITAHPSLEKNVLTLRNLTTSLTEYLKCAESEGYISYEIYDVLTD